MKKLFTVFMLMMVVMPAVFVAVPADAQTQLNKDTMFGGNATGGSAGINSAMGNLSQQDPRVVAARIINVLLGFLGIIAVVIVLLGGFKWMTAAGSEDKIAEAKKLIVSGIVGLAIILSAFAIAQFAIDALFEAMK